METATLEATQDRTDVNAADARPHFFLDLRYRGNNDDDSSRLELTLKRVAILRRDPREPAGYPRRR